MQHNLLVSESVKFAAIVVSSNILNYNTDDDCLCDVHVINIRGIYDQNSVQAASYATKLRAPEWTSVYV